jgi:hypothetical protein
LTDENWTWGRFPNDFVSECFIDTGSRKKGPVILDQRMFFLLPVLSLRSLFVWITRLENSVAKSDLFEIPGIGATFVKDFARISIHFQRVLVDQIPERLYEDLCEANRRLDHKTSKNYLYVLRLAVYYANGGRDPAKLKWNAWKD